MRRNPLPCCLPVSRYSRTLPQTFRSAAARGSRACPVARRSCRRIGRHGLIGLETCWTTDFGFCSFDSFKKIPVPQLVAIAK